MGWWVLVAVLVGAATVWGLTGYLCYLLDKAHPTPRRTRQEPPRQEGQASP